MSNGNGAWRGVARTERERDDVAQLEADASELDRHLLCGLRERHELRDGGPE